MVDVLVNKVKLLFYLLRQRRYRAVLRAVGQRLYSDRPAVGLRRDLAVPFSAASAKVALQVRPLEASDVGPLLTVDEREATDEFALLRVNQSRLMEAGLGTCYVAIREDGQPCYMQLLIGADENEHLQRYFHGLMPVLEPDVALLEGAYTPPEHRGQGIMSDAMARIAEKAADLGARYVITFVSQENVASLKGCTRAGFTPYMQRMERNRFFRRSIAFGPLATQARDTQPA